MADKQITQCKKKKQCWKTYLTGDCHKPSGCKYTIFAKLNKSGNNKGMFVLYDKNN